MKDRILILAIIIGVPILMVVGAYFMQNMRSPCANPKLRWLNYSQDEAIKQCAYAVRGTQYDTQGRGISADWLAGCVQYYNWKIKVDRDFCEIERRRK